MEKMITIGITGGAGFIGFSLANYLSKKKIIKSSLLIILSDQIKQKKL